jgi:hypothetical protein
MNMMKVTRITSTHNGGVVADKYRTELPCCRIKDEKYFHLLVVRSPSNTFTEIPVDITDFYLFNVGDKITISIVTERSSMGLFSKKEEELVEISVSSPN